MPNVGQPHQTHRQPKGWLWYHALNLSINDHFTTHITYSEWEDPDKSQNPIPTTSPVGEITSPHRETSDIQKLQGTKERSVGGSQQSAALADSSLTKLLNSGWNAAPLSLKVKNTQRVTHVHAKTHFPSSLTSAWLCLWQWGRLLQLAFWPSQGHPLQLHIIWRRAVRSPQVQVCPKGLILPRSGPERLFQWKKKVKNSGILCSFSSSSYSTC